MSSLFKFTSLSSVLFNRQLVENEVRCLLFNLLEKVGMQVPPRVDTKMSKKGFL